jgi:hypothetical protein
MQTTEINDELSEPREVPEEHNNDAETPNEIVMFEESKEYLNTENDGSFTEPLPVTQYTGTESQLVPNS